MTYTTVVARFDSPLTEAVSLNVVAVQRVVELGKKMARMEALVSGWRTGWRTGWRIGWRRW